MMSIERLKASQIPTLDASNLTYQVEKIRIHDSGKTEPEALLTEVNSRKEIPSNLEYIDDFYDPSTGTSGTAFKDKTTGKVVVSYTGTNPDGEFIKDGLRMF